MQPEKMLNVPTDLLEYRHERGCFQTVRIILELRAVFRATIGPCGRLQQWQTQQSIPALADAAERMLHNICYAKGLCIE